MTEALSVRLGELADMGWSVKFESETTAALETRAPFNWWLCEPQSYGLSFQ